MDLINGVVENTPPITGVIDDSSSNIINMLGQSGGSGRGSNYSYDEYLDWKLQNPMMNTLSYPQWLDFMKMLDDAGSPVNNTANSVVNDVTRGEETNPGPESSKDYIERITGILASGIYTAKEQNALNLAEAEKTREFNASEAEKARQFQLMMRDSQVQRTMQQLKDAGINPLLALSGSLSYANASSPAQASSSHTTFGNDNSIMSALILAVASALGSLTKILGFLPGDYSISTNF